MSELRYYEHFVDDGRTDWILIKDRATGKVFLVNGDDRADCLFVLAAMNASEQVEQLA